jgi:hypothetical protein
VLDGRESSEKPQADIRRDAIATTATLPELIRLDQSATTNSSYLSAFDQVCLWCYPLSRLITGLVSTMSREIYPNYPPDLNEEQLQYLITNVKDWSIANGLAVRPLPSWVSKEQDPAGSLAVTAPVTLFPSLFPRNCFEQGLGIQTAYNELYAAIASNETWLKQIVEE